MQAFELPPNHSTPLFTRSIGQSAEGRDILLHGVGSGHGGTLIIAGFHGDEPGTVLVTESFLDRYVSKGACSGKVLLIPLANPDGHFRHTRYNAHGVDLNRNFATNWDPESEEPPGDGPLSEPESQILHQLILSERPQKIVSLHWALAEIDADGPQSTRLAQAMWDTMSEEERLPYRMRIWEHAPGRGQRTDVCPGSLGQWCGYELQYQDGSKPAMITLELPYDPHIKRPIPLPDDHLATLRRTWAENAEGYLAAIEGPIHKMLLAACRM